jgi:hypothetical protein
VRSRDCLAICGCVLRFMVHHTDATVKTVGVQPLSACPRLTHGGIITTTVIIYNIYDDVSSAQCFRKPEA